MCGKMFTAVAYGLAIAKVALKIQATESQNMMCLLI